LVCHDSRAVTREGARGETPLEVFLHPIEKFVGHSKTLLPPGVPSWLHACMIAS